MVLALRSPAVAGTTEELLAKGWQLYEKKDYADAAEVFNKVVQLEPACADGYYGRGMTRSAQGNFDAAIKDLSETIRLDPRKGWPFRSRGEVHYLRGKPAALADLSEAIRLDPGDVPAYVNRSAVHLAKEDYDPAIADASEAIRLFAKCADAYSNRSAAYCER